MSPSPPRSDDSARREVRVIDAFSTAALVIALVVAGCSTSPDDPTALPPGINDTFLDEGMNLDRYVKMFEGESRAIFAKRFEIVEALDLTPGDSVADIGAGTGFFSFLFADAVGRTGKVSAVEISPKFLELLSARKEERGLDNLEVVEGTERSVELATASTDLAFICDVYHHFAHPQDSLASLHDAIRPGGSLVLVDFHRIEGETNAFIMKHVRAGREVFQAEVEAAGFRFVEEIEIEGLDDNYILRFERS